VAGPLHRYAITLHAAMQMKRRGVDESTVRNVLTSPEDRIPVRPGREIFQSRMETAGKEYLIRVFVDVDRTPAEVVTVYRTSKISKYTRCFHEGKL